MNIFLTGGTGFVGQELIKQLVNQGYKVTALVRNPSSAQAAIIAKLGATLVKGDVKDKESMREPMSKATQVIHNAAVYELGVDAKGETQMQQINVEGTRNVLALAQELAIEKVVYVSTTWAYGDSGNQSRDETFIRNTESSTVYERTKTEAHLIAKNFISQGLPLVVVCPNAILGCNDHSAFGHFLRMSLNGVLPPTAWSPDVVITSVALEDLVNGIILALKKGRVGETYLLCGDPQTLRQVFAYWVKYANANKFIMWMPASTVKYLFWPIESLQRYFNIPAIMSRETVEASTKQLNYNSQKAITELGWSYQKPEQMWQKICAEEIALLKTKRKGQTLIQRIRPFYEV